MKFRPFLLPVLILAVVCSTSSCVKKYICRCEITYSGIPGLPDTAVHEYDISDTKSKAQSKCEENSYEKEVNYIKTKETCTLY
ncbi:MAG: hypothetical protein K0Q79_1851 [Flavipsychrobacter sp.]|jgi:hypothetical protein|nr:hypothetical protein [Flavipsychrobacter sp.]